MGSGAEGLPKVLCFGVTELPVVERVILAEKEFKSAIAHQHHEHTEGND